MYIYVYMYVLIYILSCEHETWSLRVNCLSTPPFTRTLQHTHTDVDDEPAQPHLPIALPPIFTECKRRASKNVILLYNLKKKWWLRKVGSRKLARCHVEGFALALYYTPNIAHTSDFLADSSFSVGLNVHIYLICGNMSD